MLAGTGNLANVDLLNTLLVPHFFENHTISMSYRSVSNTVREVYLEAFKSLESAFLHKKIIQIE